MNRIFRWIVKSLFSPVTGTSGAIASSIGFFLSFLPLHGFRILLLVILSLLLRLNIFALLLGALISIFIPVIRHLPFLNIPVLEGDFFNSTAVSDWLSSILKHQIQLSRTLTAGILGGSIGLICYFIFHWFYNLGLKKKERKQDHIFLDPAKRRWSIIKRVCAGFTALVVIVSVLFLDSLNTNPSVTGLKLPKKAETTTIKPINQSLRGEQLSSQLQTTGFSPQDQRTIGTLNKHVNKITKQEVYGFYVNWDQNSKASFEQNIHSITTLLPEWLQLTPSLTFKTSTDSSIAKEAKDHHIKILPLVNNFINHNWDSEALHHLLTNPNAEDRFIQNLLNYVKKNHFNGINIDFEGLNPNDKANFTHFVDGLSKQFHQQGLMVTLDVPPNNTSYDYTSLAAAVDRVIVMLYDQHNAMTHPGPIASNDWVKESLSQLTIPSQKLIVSLGSYGYDWEENSHQPPKTMTYGDILNLGLGTHIKIYWNKPSGNPYLRYTLNGQTHIVWFLDAATFYNQMKLGINGGSKGIAVWRLGSEDPSIWKYINQPKELSKPAGSLKTLISPERVDFTGSGELLKIMSQSEKGQRTIQTDSNGMIQNEIYTKLPKPIIVNRYGKPKTKEIALTFDDGPNPNYTPKILHILDKSHIKATFFIVGRNAELHPGLIKKMYEDGQEIGSHTFTHPNIAAETPFQTRMELNANQRLFEEITGHSMTLFRPPYQIDVEPRTVSELEPLLRAQDLGYTTVGAAIDTNDWKAKSSQEIIKNVFDQLQNGNVILFHDAGGNRSNTVKALPVIIKKLKKRGYTFTTVGHLIGKSDDQIMPPVNKNPYFIYDKAVFKVMQGFRLGLSALFYSAIL